ncbi:MAG: hypothetical protein WCJ32_14030 [Actinomycetota bacterium]
MNTNYFNDTQKQHQDAGAGSQRLRLLYAEQPSSPVSRVTQHNVARRRNVSVAAIVRVQDSPAVASEAHSPIHGAVRSWSIGERVRVQRKQQSSGSWPRFVGRVGTVQFLKCAETDEIDDNFGKVDEVGVVLDDGQSNRCVWFKVDELEFDGLIWPLPNGEATSTAAIAQLQPTLGDTLLPAKFDQPNASITIRRQR